MTTSFFIFQVLYILVFAQARVLHTQSEQLSPNRSLKMSFSVILGWISYSALFVYFGIEYSWMTTILGLIITAILSGIVTLLFPPIYLICRFWPLLLVTLLFLEFYK